MKYISQMRHLARPTCRTVCRPSCRAPGATGQRGPFATSCTPLPFLVPPPPAVPSLTPVRRSTPWAWAAAAEVTGRLGS